MSLVQVTKSTATAVDLLYRDTALPASSDAFTCIFAHLANAGSASFGAMGLRANTAENGGAFIGCYITSAGIYRVNSATGAAYAGYSENAILTDTTNVVWIAIVSDTTNIRTYYKAGASGAFTAGPTKTALSLTPARMMCAQGSNSAIGKRGAFRFWGRALSVGEIAREFAQRTPNKYDGLLFASACLGSTSAVDESGHGDLTTGTDLAQSSVTGDPLVPWRFDDYSRSLGTVIGAGVSTETDASIALALSKRVAAGRANESDAALAVALSKRLTAGRANEADTALVLALSKRLSTARSNEIDSAIALTLSKRFATGRANELDAALGLVFQGFTTARADEADLALSLALSKRLTVGRATELDAALALTLYKRSTTGCASETDSAMALALSKRLASRRADETDLAMALGLLGGIVSAGKVYARFRETYPHARAMFRQTPQIVARFRNG